MHAIKRLAPELCIALLAAACSPPTTPPAVMNGPYTLSGAVSEITSNAIRPIDNAFISAWIQQGTFGYSYMAARGPTVSDAGGSYRLPAIPEGATGWLQVWKDGYVQQCATPIAALHGDLKLDVQLVSKANLSASLSSVPLPGPAFRVVSGTILETTSTGLQPVAGANVVFEPVDGFPAAVTFSDAGGHYLLCGVPTGETVELGASLGPSRVGWLSVPPGQNTGVDIVLPE